MGEKRDKIAFLASRTPQAQQALEKLTERYNDVPLDEANVVVALGGDGLMLRSLHKVMNTDLAVYGMNCGSVGFLMNEFSLDDLPARLKAALNTDIHPLSMVAVDKDGVKHEALALNEVSMLRASYQAAKIRIEIDGKTRMQELVCDGVLLSTPAGSTAYNLSANGPILPIDAHLLALTPISAFRPRRWRGAILPDQAEVTFHMLEADKRPVHAVADNVEFTDIIKVTVSESRKYKASMLFDPGHSLDERVLAEQFRY